MVESTEVQQFLTEFAQAFTLNEPEKAVEFCSLPSIIIGDNGKRVVNSKSELAAFYTQFITTLQKSGIVKFEPTVNKTMRLSDTLFFTNIKWQLYDKNNTLFVQGSSSYTLQKMENGDFKIIITVIDDEEKQLVKFFPL